MKKLFMMLLLIAFGLSTWSCQQENENPWNEVEITKPNFTQLNQELSTIQTLVDAQNNNKTISSIEEKLTEYAIIFDDGTNVTVEINHNCTLDNIAPEIGVSMFEGIYYWMITKSGEWVVDSKGNKIPVVAKEGVSHKITVDDTGYWTLNDARIKDATNNELKNSGVNINSLFKSIIDGNNEVTFKLTNGSKIVLIKSSAQFFSFEKPADGRDFIVIDFGKRKSLPLRINNIVSAEIMTIPDGWGATLNMAKKSLSVQPPSVTKWLAYSGGIITLKGINKDGNTVFASVDICASVDYNNTDGTFVVCEGNMTTVNGMLVYYDKAGKEYTEVFEQANKGLEIGNVVQDMYMANGKIYLLTQNGSNMDGAGRFVVCDARTMRMEYSDPLEFKTPDGKAAWPQHLVIVSETKGYVQYSEAGMEATSGICEVTLNATGVTVGATVEGTYGKFTTEGAIKTRMVYSRGKIFVGCGHNVLIINPDGNKTEKRLTYSGQQVKGIVKGADGNIWFTLAGTFTGNQNGSPKFTSNAKIIAIDHSGAVVQEKEMPAEIKLPVATWSPGVGMCASFKEPYIYFVDSNAFSASTASRYNYSTQTFDVKYISGYETIYGIMGVHPTTNKLWVGKSSYIDSNIYVYNVSGQSPLQEQMFSYPTQKGASPASIDFAYRFTPEYLNK